MILNNEVEFCEDNAISIGKFMSDNFSVLTYPSKKDKRNKKNRLKHDGIKDWPNVVGVSLHFACRNKILVLTGKIIIVKDDFGAYRAYINPLIIMQHYDDYNENKVMTEQLIKEEAENIRLINHFNGKEELTNSIRIQQLLMEIEDAKLVRKKD